MLCFVIPPAGKKSLTFNFKEIKKKGFLTKLMHVWNLVGFGMLRENVHRFTLMQINFTYFPVCAYIVSSFFI